LLSFFLSNNLKIHFTPGAILMNIKECTNCGNKFETVSENDICPDCGRTFWKCEGCGYTLTAPAPPETCPGCNKKCLFKNVTCYTPECGGPGNIDKRL
jgi:rubrerythrin